MSNEEIVVNLICERIKAIIRRNEEINKRLNEIENIETEDSDKRGKYELNDRFKEVKV